MLTRGFSDFARLRGGWGPADSVRAKSDMPKEWSTAQTLTPHSMYVRSHTQILDGIRM